MRSTAGLLSSRGKSKIIKSTIFWVEWRDKVSDHASTQYANPITLRNNIKKKTVGDVYFLSNCIINLFL